MKNANSRLRTGISVLALAVTCTTQAGCEFGIGKAERLADEACWDPATKAAAGQLLRSMFVDEIYARTQGHSPRAPKSDVEVATSVTVTNFFVDSRVSDSPNLMCGATLKVEFQTSVKPDLSLSGQIVKFEAVKGERPGLISVAQLGITAMVDTLEAGR